MLHRRSFIALAAAPAIVRAESLMRIVVPKPVWHTGGFLRNESFDLILNSTYGKLAQDTQRVVPYSSCRIALLAEREWFPIPHAELQRVFDEWFRTVSHDSLARPA